LIAGGLTSPAANAAAFADHYLDIPILPFRVVAPPAAQWAALEENRCTDAWTIMDTIFFNIENNTGRQGINL
jgi:hypothetical protein